MEINSGEKIVIGIVLAAVVVALLVNYNSNSYVQFSLNCREKNNSTVKTVCSISDKAKFLATFPNGKYVVNCKADIAKCPALYFSSASNPCKTTKVGGHAFINVTGNRQLNTNYACKYR